MISSVIEYFQLTVSNYLVNIGEPSFCFDHDTVELLSGIVLCFRIVGHLVDEGIHDFQDFVEVNLNYGLDLTWNRD